MEIKQIRVPKTYKQKTGIVPLTCHQF